MAILSTQRENRCQNSNKSVVARKRVKGRDEEEEKEPTTSHPNLAKPCMVPGGPPQASTSTGYLCFFYHETDAESKKAIHSIYSVSVASIV